MSIYSIMNWGEKGRWRKVRWRWKKSEQGLWDIGVVHGVGEVVIIVGENELLNTCCNCVQPTGAWEEIPKDKSLLFSTQVSPSLTDMALNLQVEPDSSDHVTAGLIQSILDLPLEQYEHCKDWTGRFLPRLPKSLEGAISGYGTPTIQWFKLTKCGVSI